MGTGAVRRRTWKSRLAWLVTCWMVGAAATVVVAWLCAYGSLRWFELRGNDPIRTLGFRQLVHHPAFHAPAIETRLAAKDAKYTPMLEADPPQLPPLVRLTLGRETVIEQSGWPCYAMSTTEYFSESIYNTPLTLGGGLRNSVVTLGIPFRRTRIAEDLLGSGRLPLRPIWFGFLVNSTLYGGCVWLVAATPRLVRRRPGRCPACSYDLSDGAVHGCPECGWGRET